MQVKSSLEVIEKTFQGCTSIHSFNDLINELLSLMREDVNYVELLHFKCLSFDSIKEIFSTYHLKEIYKFIFIATKKLNYLTNSERLINDLNVEIVKVCPKFILLSLLEILAEER